MRLLGEACHTGCNVGEDAPGGGGTKDTHTAAALVQRDARECDTALADTFGAEVDDVAVCARALVGAPHPAVATTVARWHDSSVVDPRSTTGHAMSG